MNKRYKNLTSPYVVRGKTLKSRLIYPVAQPHFLQGNEDYPAEQTIAYYEMRAKNGCAMIWMHDLTDEHQRAQPLDCGHFSKYSLTDKGAQNGMSHFAGHMHLYGTLVCPEINMGRRMRLMCNTPENNKPEPHLPAGYTDPSVVIDKHGNQIPLFLDFAATTQQGFDVPVKYDKDSKEGQDDFMTSPFRYMTREIMDEYIQVTIAHIKEYINLGYDGGLLDLSHNFPIGQFFRKKINRRDDEYGGSFENRIRFPLEVIKAIRKAAGPSYILSINSPVIGEDDMPIDEVAEFLKLCDPYVDIVQVRMRGYDHQKDDPCDGAEAAAYLKSKGVKMGIAISTPYKDLDKLEEIIALGKADFISPGHLFISNDRLNEILASGEGEDLNPCIECHCCRGTSSVGEWMSCCTINPTMGIEYRLDKICQPVRKKKRVAIIGAGPGGVKCGLYLQERGHEVVIYEKTDELGGQIKMANYPDFKWELKRYLDYLKTQAVKYKLDIRYNTEATPEMIEAEGFDVVVAACGGSAKLPDVKGAELARWDPISIYGHQEELGHKVVVIGGASSATEAAAYLSKCGHDVIQLCRKECVGYDLNPIRSIPYMNVLANISGVDTIHRAVTLEVGADFATYRDKDGEVHTITCDDVVLAGGMQPNSQLAFSFATCAPEFYMIGDCRQNGTMRHAIKDAFGVANQIV